MLWYTVNYGKTILRMCKVHNLVCQMLKANINLWHHFFTTLANGFNQQCNVRVTLTIIWIDQIMQKYPWFLCSDFHLFGSLQNYLNRFKIQKNYNISFSETVKKHLDNFHRNKSNKFFKKEIFHVPENESKYHRKIAAHVIQLNFPMFLSTSLIIIIKKLQNFPDDAI